MWILIGQSIHIGDIKPPANVEILGDKHISVIAVAAAITEAQEAAATEAATGTSEVEMIKEKKEDGATAGAAPAKGGDKAAPAAKGAAAPAAEKGGEKKAEKKK
jgi:hypothetical protein